MDSVLSLFEPHGHGVNLLDPCCGEGEALHQFKRIFPNATTCGVELNAERSEVAKSVLDKVYYADIYDVSLGRGQFDLLFLNPPYGNDFADKFSDDKTERLEHRFLKQTFPALKADGVLVYIVPKKSMDVARIKWLLARFKDVSIRKAAVDTYHQVVVIGTKLKQQRSVSEKMVEQFQQQMVAMPDAFAQTTLDYALPHSTQPPTVIVKHLTAIGVGEVAKRYRGQWLYFDNLFGGGNQSAFRQPLHELSDWHLALLITSGAVQGVVDNGKRRLLVKGATKKHKQHTQSQTVDAETETVITVNEAKDRFSAQIKAIDIDEQSSYFGEIITIK